jgi:small nuclear ribonucleoprotein (snRNP)-like protein
MVGEEWIEIEEIQGKLVKIDEKTSQITLEIEEFDYGTDSMMTIEKIYNILGSNKEAVEEYKQLIGKTVTVELMDEEIYSIS